MVRSIAVVSLGKGTGKTTLALNLGLALHKLDHKVLVFDTDFTKDNMLEHLGLHDIPVNLGQVFDGDAHITDVVYKHVTGMNIIPSMVHSPGPGYDKLAYHYQDLCGDYDYIILDTPSTQEHLEFALKNADEAIIIHSPQYSSKDVSDMLDILSRLKVMNLGIVLNHSQDNAASKLFDYPVLEKIPTHKDITKSYKLKNPVLHTHPKSSVSKRFTRLAKKFE